MNDAWYLLSIYGDAQRYLFKMHLFIFNKKINLKKNGQNTAQVFCRYNEGGTKMTEIWETLFEH